MWRQYRESREGRKAYLRWNFSSMKGHYGLLTTMLFAAILNLNWKDAVNIIATHTILLQAIISAVLFFRRRAIVVVQMELVVFQGATYRNYTNIALVLQDDINEFTGLRKLGVYIIHDYVLSMCMVVSISAVILSTVVADYLLLQEKLAADEINTVINGFFED